MGEDFKKRNLHWIINTKKNVLNYLKISNGFRCEIYETFIKKGQFYVKR